MRLFLVSIFVILTPSILMVAWLLWQAKGAKKVSGLDLDC